MSKITKASIYSLLKEHALEASCFLLIFGLFFSRAILSISLVLMLLTAIYSFYQNQKINPIKLKHYFFIGLYILICLSFWNTSDKALWLNILFKNSFLWLLPLVFTFAKTPQEATIRRLVLFFGLCGVLCISVDLWWVLSHQPLYKEIISRGGNIRSVLGPYHTELSLLYSIAFIALCISLLNQPKPYKWLMIACLCLLVSGLIAVAQRFALSCLLLNGLFFMGREIIITKNYKYIGYVMLVLLATIIVYQKVPAVKQKFLYTKNDIINLIENKNPNYLSISQRWAANKCALEVVKKNMFTGVAPADLEQEMDKQYASYSYWLIPKNRVFVHNQYLYYLASYGVIFSFLIFVFGFILLWRAINKNILSLAFIIPIIFHMFTDNSMERQISGVSIVFLLLLFTNIKIKTLSER
jgi:hypothetical protein